MASKQDFLEIALIGAATGIALHFVSKVKTLGDKETIWIK